MFKKSGTEGRTLKRHFIEEKFKETNFTVEQTKVGKRSQLYCENDQK